MPSGIADQQPAPFEIARTLFKAARIGIVRSFIFEDGCKKKFIRVLIHVIDIIHDPALNLARIFLFSKLDHWLFHPGLDAEAGDSAVQTSSLLKQ
ncbi:MAG: hypothetical protein A2W33_04530 [Chloroflexi bacterium RBG_16_52_11]|nr:MAG: hypothetical protein A2W33_04530 [Chloroflexi bacterium RBG_16_52_11]